MEFSTELIRTLYGKTFFLVKDPPANLQDGYQLPQESPIRWISKPNGKLTCIIENSEFKNKEYTELLKNIVSALQIPFDAVSFGVIKRPFLLEDLKEQTTLIGIVFGMANLPAGAENPVTIGPKQTYFVPSLAEMNLDQAHKRTAWNLMKQFKDQLIG